MKKVICFQLLVMLSLGQMVALTQVEEEVGINVSDATPSISEEIKNKELQFDKVYETDTVSLELLKDRFKNVVLLIYDSNDETQQSTLDSILAEIDKERIDIVFVKMSSDKSELEKGIHLKHLNQQYYFANNQNLSQNIQEIVDPKIQYLENQSQVEEYLKFEENQVLVLLNREYQQYQLVKDQLEVLLRDGNLIEAQINDIKIFEGNWQNYTAPTLLLKGSEGNLEQYEYNLTYADQVLDFLYLESLPLVVKLNELNYARVFGGSVGTQVHLLIDESNEQQRDILQSIRSIATQNKEEDLKYQRLLFTYSNYKDNMDLWELFDFDENTITPQLVITETNFRKFQLQKYICPYSDLTEENIRVFLNDFKERNLKQFFKSESKSHGLGNIAKIVGSTFTDEIVKRNRNVLLLYWDSKNPQASEQHFNLLKEYAEIVNTNNVKIGSFDLALNEHHRITIDSAPKLVLYLTADKKEPKEYLRSSRLNIEELKAWLDYWLGEGKAYLEKIDL